jgi:hypothetical protein
MLARHQIGDEGLACAGPHMRMILILLYLVLFLVFVVALLMSNIVVAVIHFLDIIIFSKQLCRGFEVTNQKTLYERGLHIELQDVLKKFRLNEQGFR